MPSSLLAQAFRTHTHTQHTLARHMLMRRTTQRTRQHKDRLRQLCIIAGSQVWKQQRLWGYFWLAFAQVHKGDQPLLPIRFRSFVRHGPKSDAVPPCLKNLQADSSANGSICHHVQVCTHTQALMMQGFIMQYTARQQVLSTARGFSRPVLVQTQCKDNVKHK